MFELDSISARVTHGISVDQDQTHAEELIFQIALHGVHMCKLFILAYI